MTRKPSFSAMPTILSEETLRRTADIIGANSAAAMALADIHRRRAEGEDPVCYQDGTSLAVGPRLDVPESIAAPGMRI